MWVLDSRAMISPLTVPLSADNDKIPPAQPYVIVAQPIVIWSAPLGKTAGDSASVIVSASYDSASTFEIIDYPAWLYIDTTMGVVPRTLFLRAAYDSIPFGVY